MKNYSRIGLGATICFALLFLSCKNSGDKREVQVDKTEVPELQLFKIVTNAMDFVGKDTITAGWTKIVYENRSTEPHFILLDKYPEGKSVEDTHRDIVPPFDEGMALIMEGKNEEAMEAFGKLPEWFGQIVFSGGTGLISAGKTAVSYVKMEPGYYIMECYVKMPDGKFHTSMGMTKEFYVTEGDNRSLPPGDNVQIKLSSTAGIQIEGTMSPGTNIFRVDYEDQIVHENFVGHDISLVQLDEGADLEALEKWMNWATPKGLMSASLPAGITFLGGTNDAPAGTVHYFEAELSPGNYILISEVPNSLTKGMLQPFSVSE